MSTEPGLQRRVGPIALTIYGVGTIIGAGIYVLVGEVARASGTSLPYAFLTAGLIAALTGACYAELSSRLPRAAGSVLYVDQAFGKPGFSIAAGFIAMLTAVVSAATITKGFVGYLEVYVQLPSWISIVGLCLVMGTITSVGIRESVWVIGLLTCMEVGGLLLVIAFARGGEVQPVELVFSPGPVMLGAFLAFYAFIGFEDMVNVAEEVKNPRRNMPLAILLSIVLSGFLYVLVAVIAIRHVDLSLLKESRAPMALMVGGHEMIRQAVALIAVVSVTGGALTQIIMASRMLYGMSSRGLAPAVLGKVNATTHTPVISTWLATTVVAIFALSLPLVTLAKTISAIVLLLFMMVSTALIALRKSQQVDDGIFQVWWWVPPLSLLTNFSLLLYQGWSLATE